MKALNAEMDALIAGLVQHEISINNLVERASELRRSLLQKEEERRIKRFNKQRKQLRLAGMEGK